MKTKLYTLGVIISSLFGYLEWGNDNHAFLYNVEGEVLHKLFSEPGSILHPFVIFPLLGQLILLTTLTMKNANKWIIFIGISCIGCLLGFMFFVGVISQNLKIMLSVIPFMIFAYLTINIVRKNGTK
jgi:cobalamin biosynthesis protein CobD/CbiB